MGDNSSALHHIVASLTTMPVPCAVSYLRILVHTVRELELDDSWETLRELLCNTKAFPDLKVCDIKIHACNARRAAEQDVKDLVIYVREVFHENHVNFKAQVNRRLGAHVLPT